MNTTTLFDIEEFQSLRGMALVKFAEALLHELAPISNFSLAELSSQFNDYDIEHKVYALELGMTYAPSMFINHAVESLSNTDASVCSTAARVLLAQAELLKDESLQQRLAQVPCVELHTISPSSNEPVRVGTNEELLRQLRV